MTSIMDFNGEE